MRNRQQWLRYGVLSMVVAAGGFSTFLIACGDDDEGVVAPGADGGPKADAPTTTNDATTAPDTSKPDTGPTDNRPPAKLQLVNAATGFGPANPTGMIRICYALGADAASARIAAIPPLPDRKANPALPFAGIPIGTGGVAETTGFDLSTVVIVPYVMNALKLQQIGQGERDGGPGTSCEDLLKADAGTVLQEGADYFKLPPIEAGKLGKGKSLLLTLTGCAGSETGGSGLNCGPGFSPGTSNLTLSIHELDNTTPIDGTKIGTQFVHASPAGATALTVAGGAIPGYIVGDAGDYKSVSADAAVPLNTKSNLVQVDGIDVTKDKFTVNPANPQLAVPLQSIQLLSYGGNVPDGGAYRQGAAFTFIAVGDPTQDRDGGNGGASFNFRSFHYLGLPNDPAVVQYRP